MDNIPVQTTFSKDKFIFSIKEEVTGYDYIAFKFNTDTILEIKQNGLSYYLKDPIYFKMNFDKQKTLRLFITIKDTLSNRGNEVEVFKGKVPFVELHR